MSRLPIRLRLTLAFAVAMALVLAAVGAFLYARVDAALREQLDDSLEVRAATLATLVQEGKALPPDDDESLTAVYPAGLLPDDLPSPDQRPRFLSRQEVPAFDGHDGRLLVTRAGDEVVVVGASLEDHDETLDELLTQLLVVGPLALLLAAGVGYVVSAAALRPVEAMRRRAEDVSSERTGQRLPLPAAHDEIRRLGETLNAMLGRLEAGLERERRFVADASHELRTPLALLRAELELALRRPRAADELGEALRSAAGEVDRLTRLAEDLLVLARLEEGGLPLRRETLSAAELLETVARRFARRADEAGRSLRVEVGSDLRFVGDRLRLEQALGNLVDNALTHGAGTVCLAAAQQDGTVELRVSDEGAGFPPDFVGRAFDRFSRSDGVRGGGSTGLGLSIVDAIARAHGGSAGASNATVEIRVPAEGG
jgi:signal transduction histidine kinase